MSTSGDELRCCTTAGVKPEWISSVRHTERGKVVEEDIGVAFKRARLDKKLSLRQIADQLGISTSLLSQVENGKTQPSVKTLFGLATVLEVSLDKILSGRSGLDIELPQNRDAAAGIQRAADNPVLEMENGVSWAVPTSTSNSVSAPVGSTTITFAGTPFEASASVMSPGRTP